MIRKQYFLECTSLINGRADTAGEAWQRWTRRIRQDWERCYLVETCERFFLGNQHEWSVLHPWFDMHDEACTCNYLWVTIQAQLPSLSYQNPTFHVTPTGLATTLAAERNAAMLEALLESIGLEDR